MHLVLVTVTASAVKSTQRSDTRVKSKDFVLKCYFGKSENHPYEYLLSKSLKVSDIELT